MDSEALGFLPRRWELNRADGEALTSHQGTDRGNSRRTVLPSVTGSSVRDAEDGRTPTESGVTLRPSAGPGSGGAAGKHLGPAPRAQRENRPSSHPQGSK